MLFRSHAHEREPRTVRVEVGEREPFEAGSLQPSDVVFDMRVGAHDHIQHGGDAGLVGVVAPVSERVGGEQGVLHAGVSPKS